VAWIEAVVGRVYPHDLVAAAAADDDDVLAAHVV
jgi:hypothetical protein